MFEFGSEDDPHLVAHVDQTEARFKALLRELSGLVVVLEEESAAPDDMAFYKFANALDKEIAEHGSVPFVSYVIAQLLQAHVSLHRLANAMGSIQGITIDNMLPSPTKLAMESALATYMAEMDAEQQLFQAPTVEQPKPRESYTTGSGQQLANVHRADECLGVCVIHAPIDGPWRDWPTYWIEDIGMMYRTCPHGNLHPAIEDWLRSPSAVTSHDCACDCQCGPAFMQAQMDNLLGGNPNDPNKDDGTAGGTNTVVP